MIALLSLFLHILVSPFKTQARLEAQSRSSTSAERPASAGSFEAETDGRRPSDLRMALPSLPISLERHLSDRARDPASVSSDGLPTVLAQEVALSWRSAKHTSGDPPPDQRHEPGELALECAAHPRRTPEARYRSRSVDGRQVHGEEWARAVADLEDLSPQPCGRYCRHGLPGRADGRLQVAIRVGHPQAPTAAADITHGDDQSNGRVDRHQITDAFPWNEASDYPIRDRDGSYGHGVTRRLAAMGIGDHPTASRSPWQNGHVERLIGSIRRECLDFGDTHLRRILGAYTVYCNELRTHLSLDKDSPNRRPIQRLGHLTARLLSADFIINIAGCSSRQGQCLVRVVESPDCLRIPLNSQSIIRTLT
jgi:transposase InsO family protein